MIRRFTGLLLLLLVAVLSCSKQGRQKSQQKGSTPNAAAMPTTPTRDKTCVEMEEDFQRSMDLKSDDPQKVLLATGFQMLLAKLGYGATFTGAFDEQTWAAVRNFQARHGFQVSSRLDCETLKRLQEDSEAYDRLEWLHHLQGDGLGFVDSWDKGYASAKGTWTISNDAMANPFQVSDLKCDKSQMSCIEATGTMFGHSLMVETETYEIERWDKYEIVSKPRDTNCTRYVLRFNRTQKQVTGTRSTIRNGMGCEGVEKKEFHLILANGSDVHENERRKLADKFKKAVFFQGRALTLRDE